MKRNWNQSKLSVRILKILGCLFGLVSFFVLLWIGVFYLRVSKYIVHGSLTDYCVITRMDDTGRVLPKGFGAHAVPKKGYAFLCWEDGETSPIRTNTDCLKAYFVPNSSAPSVHLQLDGSIETEYKECAVFTEQDGVSELENEIAKVRIRGNTTAALEKKAYKLKFETKQQPFGVGEGKAKEWVLLAEYLDLTLSRNYMTFWLGNRLNIDYVSDCQYVNLFVNDKYQGLYLLCEQTEIGKTRINVTEDSTLDTGYLLELDHYILDEDGTEGIDYFTFQLEGGDYVYAVKGKEKTAEQVAHIKAEIYELYKTFMQGNREKIEKIFDVESAVDMVILHDLANDPDINWSSFYLSKDKKGKIRFNAPWDFDLSYGNYVGFEDPEIVCQNELVHMLMSHEWFSTLVKERWQEINRLGILEEFQKLPDQVYKQYQEDIERNDIAHDINRILHEYKLPLAEVQTSTVLNLNDLYDSVEYLKNWLGGRIAFLNRFYS